MSRNGLWKPLTKAKEAKNNKEKKKRIKEEPSKLNYECYEMATLRGVYFSF